MEFKLETESPGKSGVERQLVLKRQTPLSVGTFIGGSHFFTVGAEIEQAQSVDKDDDIICLEIHQR